MLELKNNTKVVGVKQSLKKMNNKDCRCLCIAKNAEKIVIQPLIDKAKDLSVEIVYIDTMTELGEICDIDVGAAAALFLKEQ
ncbi:ribosomal L7Ae/L30e/S12e/Gadd45 family protein [Oceanirhabdus seepicola]|uniref:Ribosomal L7Ae/L30e/S12e/Gadd45 family protein n=1 Tax=Oceanirhabdus seepicola TaxID=2828781 RepID=A0A9J6NYN2_9CLOT|nr:ribosomal L7Ae/L30e/S12e/Gadd45 family protein [Oceanirhabdus seepicola]MCM1989639.1 ribosomal L7Ae/L30e/S12e/Gadd45 family protein [Oceanirhabdus seepicola]